MADLDAIIKQIKQLSPDEWAQIKKSVNPWFGVGGGVPKLRLVQSDYTDEGWILETICTTMERLTGDPFSAAKVRHNAHLMAEFRDRLPDLLRYMSVIDRRKRQGFLAVGIELLVESMSWWSAPLSTALVIRNLHRLPAAYDKAFPGYHKAGLLNLVFHVKKKGR